MKKRLERDQQNVVLSGVLSGLAKYFDQDPILFRVIAVALLVVTGFFPGVILYAAAWLMIPKSGPIKVNYEVTE